MRRDPPDQAQRRQILEKLDQNMLVEAAAGTGKTHSMVGRMVALLRTGGCAHVRTLAAVTFTRKAAAELRARFQIALEQAVRSTSGEGKTRLDSALSQVEQCYVGTIHSFCARLLRERPVEAQVDIAFEELDEDADLRLRKEAWDAYCTASVVSDPRGAQSPLDEVGLSLGDLEKAFVRFADFPDVDKWPGSREGLPDPKPAIQQIREFSKHMRELAKDLPTDPGNDTLIPAYKSLPRVISHYKNLHEPRQLMEVLEFFKGKNTVLQEWTKQGIFSKDQAKAEKVRWQNFCDEIAQPYLTAWYEYRYAPIIQIMQQAKEVYDRLRTERRVLNYQDLLIKAAKLLRDNPHVRRYFSRRITHLLVDEFQDTDPIQAEVMMLLTATDPKETNWRKCTPKTGSLFVVGDPKQSIYRFRRADIVTYNATKEIIASGQDGLGEKGLVVQLSANFRTSQPVVDWINHAFAPEFPPSPTQKSPAYVPLEKGRIDEQQGDLSGVRVLRVPKNISMSNAVAIEYEADLIARTIRFALDNQKTISRTSKELVQGKSPTVSPADFLIIARKRSHLTLYAQKLQDYGIPHQVTGGCTLNEVWELKLLHICLVAVIQPDNPVALVAALRSELFGVSDATLYAFKKAGGEFSYNSSIPDGLAEKDSQAIKEAFFKLKNYSQCFSKLPPIAAIEKMVADLGLLVMASAKEGGDIQAGSLSKAIEVLRSVQNEMWTVAQLVDYLAQLLEKKSKLDGISALSEEKPVVRIMNLHKAKGLEAPVVFLADPTGESKHQIGIHIDRSGLQAKGYLSIIKDMGSNWQMPLAQPPEWKEYEESEKDFLEKEELRLRYVAATRAGSLLVISQRDAFRNYNPWRELEQYLQDIPNLEDPGEQRAPTRGEEKLPFESVEKARVSIFTKLETVRKPTYVSSPAKSYAMSQGSIDSFSQMSFTDAEAPTNILPEEGEHGVEWGSVIHLLLQVVAQNPRSDLARLATDTLEEHELDLGLVQQAVAIVESVTRSEIWHRAINSSHRLVEVPFSILAPGDGQALPTILRGAIDLVFKEQGQWVLVDYKTDSLQNTKLQNLTKKYAPQIHLYSQAWNQCTGEKVKETGLYFTQTGEYSVVSY
ncbi:MAG: UvrD-helicase domain-containing protein [Pseudomonadota bacterium]